MFSLLFQKNAYIFLKAFITIRALQCFALLGLTKKSWLHCQLIIIDILFYVYFIKLPKPFLFNISEN